MASETKQGKTQRSDHKYADNRRQQQTLHLHVVYYITNPHNTKRGESAARVAMVAKRRGRRADWRTRACCGPGVILTASVKGAREGARVKIMPVGRPQTAGRASRSGAGRAIARRDDSSPGSKAAHFATLSTSEATRDAASGVARARIFSAISARRSGRS